jgi:signal transduction histidine kinase
VNGRSLKSHVSRLSIGWALAGVLLTLLLSGIIGFLLELHDTERHAQSFALAAVSSNRTDILSGDIRSIELRLRKELNPSGTANLLFLDEKRRPWITSLTTPDLDSCISTAHPCDHWWSRKIVVEQPVYFDDGGKNLWGYLHIEEVPKPDWSLILTIAGSIIAGMLFQGIGLYLNVIGSIQVVSHTLSEWAQELSLDPKKQGEYGVAPFSELAPIGAALSSLKSEIDVLEQDARRQGALTTLRGVGHDILNPVSRMKRILGVIQKNERFDQSSLNRLSANLKRLSGYSEQLKVIYKRQSGEIHEPVKPTNVSDEIRRLAEELTHDPETIDQQVTLEVVADQDHFVSIPSPALGRIIENLYNNGVQASGAGAKVRLSVESTAHDVTICVEDSGAGIPHANLERIFEPDFTTKSNQGTGLGLFVVKQLCEESAGKISLQSVVGEGTIFRITFPKAEVSHGI